jgi:microcystin-dependent protein
MSNPFIGEIRVVGFVFAPTGWAFCNGQLLPISQNTALFSLLGTQFGGNGTSNFALPNLQGSSPLGMGSGVGLTPRTMGESGGAPSVTLITTELPIHTHGANAVAAAGNQVAPGNNETAEIRGYLYSATANASMANNAVATAGSSQPHENLAPFLTLNFIIALTGVFPTRS